MDEGDPRKGTLMDVSKVIVEHQSGWLRPSSHIELQPQEDPLHNMLLLHLWALHIINPSEYELKPCIAFTCVNCRQALPIYLSLGCWKMMLRCLLWTTFVVCFVYTFGCMAFPWSSKVQESYKLKWSCTNRPNAAEKTHVPNWHEWHETPYNLHIP
jgi:hypothetical protein